jgi:primosomal protein N' (replication factor Y)
MSAGLSPLLREQVQAQTDAGNQVLLFLNRRGYAPVLTCHDCGWVGACPHCDARLTLHMKLHRLWCHHCGWFKAMPAKCPDCQGLDLRGLGLGTERLEEELRAVFPAVNLARIDRDSTRRKGELDRLLAASRRGEIQILLGTQMLAKGHDFPGVTLVGILDLDHSLFAADFRAPERTAQLIVQVAGRAGRADRPGRVVLQTRHPEHPLLRSLIQGGYVGFAELALEERESAQLPPFACLALLRADAPEAEVPMDFLRQGRRLAQALLEDLGHTRVQVSSPVPAPMERRAGRYRAQLLLEAPGRSGLQRFLGNWVSQLWGIPRTRGLRWSLDVDPQDMM